jgi:hypothetical protein
MLAMEADVMRILLRKALLIATLIVGMGPVPDAWALSAAAGVSWRF